MTLWVISAICGLSDFIVSAGADDAACASLNLVVEHTFCRRVHCTNFDSEFLIYPLVVGVFVVMAILYSMVCRRLRATSIVQQGRFVRRQYRGLRTSATVLSAFLIAWFPYCMFVTTIYIFFAVDIDLSMTETLFWLQRRVDYYLFDLILLGCVADPIIYAARMRQVRSGYARLWNSIAGCCVRPSLTSRGGSRRRRCRSLRINEVRSSSPDTSRRSNTAAVSTRVMCGGGNDVPLLPIVSDAGNERHL